MSENMDFEEGRKPSREITTVAELQTLDEASLVRGYLAGRNNAADYSEREKGYWHGFLNGLVDGRHVSSLSAAQQNLARDYVQSGALRSDVARWSAGTR